MNIYLIRHTSVNVAKGLLYGRTDVDVSDTFEQEAALVKEKIKEIHFDKVYTSPLKRARLLASFCGFPDAEIEKRVTETNYGDWEMTRFEENKDPRLQEWFKDYYHVRPTGGGESFLDQYERVVDFIEEQKSKPYGNVAVFTHGGVLLCATAYAGLMKPDDMNYHTYGYGHILKISIV